MPDGTNIIQAFLIGAGFTSILFLILAAYFRVGAQIRHWIATFKMKSLFWRDQRRRKTQQKKND